MQCEFNLCIYEKNGSCTLDAVDINEVGMCDCAILPTFPEKLLDEWKALCLSRIQYNQIKETLDVR